MRVFRRGLATVARFAIDAQAAERCFCAFHQASVLAPSRLKRVADAERRVVRAWIPFWVFEAHVSARFVGEVGWSQPVRRWDARTGRFEVHWSTHWKSTDGWHVLEGVHSADHPRMQVCASFDHHPHYVEAVKGPFASRTVEVDPANTPGAEWETFHVRKDAAWDACSRKLQERYLQKAEQELMGLYQAQAVRNLKLQIQFGRRKAKPVYFPAYLVQFRHLNTDFTAVVGGISGKVGSEAFYSTWKVAALAALGMSAFMGPGIPMNATAFLVQSFMWAPAALVMGWVAARWPIFMAYQRRMQASAGAYQHQEEHQQEWEWQQRHRRYEEHWREEKQKTHQRQGKPHWTGRKHVQDPKGYYRTLGLTQFGESVSLDDVKKAFRHVAMRKHPDREKDPVRKQKLEEEFKRIVEAYHVLRDPEKKRAYDLSFE